MGKGDKKTRRGKIYNGSHGKVRPHKTVHGADEKTATSGSTHKIARRRKPG